MKGTTKIEVRQKIRKYIIDHIDLENYIGYELKTEPETTNGKVLACYEIFKSEKGYEINRIGEQTAFIDWLKGLASALTVSFYYEDEKKRLAYWLDESPEMAAQYDDDKADGLYWHLLRREFFWLVDQAKKGTLK